MEMTVTEKDYVDFCNFAFHLRQAAECKFKAMPDELLRQLDDFVQSEISASPSGVELAHDFLASMLREEVVSRQPQTDQVSSARDIP